jgi:DNA mismatch repair protein MutL
MLFPRLISEVEAPYGGRVHVLPPEVAHRIAAGEVIERQASAVKELVENGLDAGATRIEVEIEGGGISLIRVRDDGSGMSSDDAALALGRHATSKISSAEDLARVVSLGFRGEALHAISSVSAMTLTTRVAGMSRATRVTVLAGGPPERSPAAHPEGTTVEVRDLFMNLPVRRGFLGTERAETNAVATVVESLARSRPDPYIASGVRRYALVPSLRSPGWCTRKPVTRTRGRGQWPGEWSLIVLFLVASRLMSFLTTSLRTAVFMPR